MTYLLRTHNQEQMCVRRLPAIAAAQQRMCPLSNRELSHAARHLIASCVVSSYLPEPNNPEKKLPRFLSFSGAGAALPPPAAGCSCEADADGKDDDTGCCCCCCCKLACNLLAVVTCAAAWDDMAERVGLSDALEEGVGSES